MTDVYTELLQENSELETKVLRLEQENKELLEARNHFMGVNLKYFNALEEIKRITEEDRNCMNSELACCQLCDKLDLIKDKINGVLNESN